MRILSLIGMFLLIASFLGAQNLVPNPSFEEYVNCPNDYGESFELVDWFMAVTNPDYYNVCDGENDTCGVPKNYSGYQQPATGDGYIGMITYSNDPPDGFRELIGVRLNEPVTIGETYYTSFKVSCTNGFPNLDNWTRYAANKLGIRLRMDSIADFSWFPLENIAQFASDSIVTDSIGWTLLSGSFIAQEPARWLYLGNFFDHASVSTAVIDPNCPDEYGYYYFDDVCLSPDPGECPLATAVVEEFTPRRIHARVEPGTNWISVSGLVAGRTYQYSLVDAFGRSLGHGWLVAQDQILLNAANHLVVLRLWDGSEELRLKIPVSKENP